MSPTSHALPAGAPVAAPAATEPALAHRVSRAVVTVRGADGAPLADADVVVGQVRHAVALGGIGFDVVDLLDADAHDPDGPGAGAPPEVGRRLAELFTEVFDTATLPFYWGAVEPERGAPRLERLERAARWFADRGVRLKGHPLVWHTVTADWLRELPTDEVERVALERVRRDVTRFAGLVGAWDVVNEAVIAPVFDNEPTQNGITRWFLERGRIPVIRAAFEAARESDPRATLLLNDFNMGTAFECLVEGVLEAGVPVDAIGLQSHMHQGYWGEERTTAVLDRFARYGLPLHMTETTLLSGDLMPAEVVDLNDFRPSAWPSTPEGEARQAEEVVRHYRTLVAHPAVQGVTYWGLGDAGAWLGAPVGLVRADGTPKPSFAALRDLVRGEWWVAPTTVRTDADGHLVLHGFLGDHRVTAGDRAADLVLDRAGDAVVDVVLR
ncbi:endo-1,4-beta-xylanase [Pseudokineococcus lusitanus]|uniref:Beta-xylanase n=1 Tax=Pseudokineococcus lusitanus TaxID=763993 RepID=A0A3N1G9Y3_9ACTN|nr:endo-1,4-beta-xylanase [Pseudokineococcus lusitanus]ROP27042.1 GH35 family endo-1,4-beta-xylanase [Pseudokineococcus lusitanus]